MEGSIITSCHLDIMWTGRYDGSMRTTLHIDDDVFEAARHLAAAERISVGRVLSRLARRGLRPAASRQVDRGFPVFKVATDAKPITPEMVRRAVDER